MQTVLAWVNQVRAERGLGDPLTELPKGIQSVGDRCVIAVALGVKCDVQPTDSSDYRGCVTFVESYDDVIDLPADVNQFARDFDRGKYPELIAGP
jgi:hypothetical protein